MNFEDEEYVRLYTKKTNTFRKLGWEGRAVLWHLMLECDRGGVIELDEGDDETEAVSALIGMPEEIVRAGLAAWADITEILRGKTHSAQKPDALYQVLIETHCNSGDTVFDPCAGSGTTARAAEACGRSSLIIELGNDV